MSLIDLFLDSMLETEAHQGSKDKCPAPKEKTAAVVQ